MSKQLFMQKGEVDYDSMSPEERMSSDFIKKIYSDIRSACQRNLDNRKIKNLSRN